jgi:hypothetical protein
MKSQPPEVQSTLKTQIIAIYGKGGIGKSFTLANLNTVWTRVLLIMRSQIRHNQPTVWQSLLTIIKALG